MQKYFDYRPVQIMNIFVGSKVFSAKLEYPWNYGY